MQTLFFTPQCDVSQFFPFFYDGNNCIRSCIGDNHEKNTSLLIFEGKTYNVEWFP